MEEIIRFLTEYTEMFEKMEQKQVEKLEHKAFRTPTEEQTLKQLKKQKLEGKTQLMAILDRLKKQG